MTAPDALPETPPPAAPRPTPTTPRGPRVMAVALGVASLVAVAALGLAWTTQNRLAALEQELVRRQQSSATEAGAARVLAEQAQDASREAAAKVALLEARVSEVALQRTQVEDLLQSMSRSRDENVVADLEAAVRVALQHSAITGSVEPLVTTLRQADERLARYNQPRLERVRRAIARDLDRVRTAGSVDIGALTLRLDEAVRMVDELPLLATVEPRRPAPAAPGRAAVQPPAAASATGPAAGAASGAGAYWVAAQEVAGRVAAQVWTEARSLLRVMRIDDPDALLLAPEQAYFVRENLKLRLLNARLALLSRQYDSAQADLREAQAVLDRWFDRGARRVTTAGELLKQVQLQSRAVAVPRPDETLAALTAVAAGR